MNAGQHITLDEYLLNKSRAETRSDFLDDVLSATAGASERRAGMAANLIRALARSLPPDCRTYGSDLLVRIEKP